MPKLRYHMHNVCQFKTSLVPLLVNRKTLIDATSQLTPKEKNHYSQCHFCNCMFLLLLKILTNKYFIKLINIIFAGSNKASA